MWESKICEGLNEHTCVYLLSPTSHLPTPFLPRFSFSFPLLNDQSGISVHLWEGQCSGWMISPHPHQRHCLAGSASDILGRYPLSGNNQWLCFSWRDRERQREGASVRGPEWCVHGARGSRALCQCVWEEAFLSCVSTTSKIAPCLMHWVNFSSIPNDDKLTILWLWSIVCCGTLY